MYYVYILKSEKDSRLYIGQTQDLQKRLFRHNQGMVEITRNRRPFTLIASQSYETRAEAMKMEKYLKRLKGGNEFKKILTRWGVVPLSGKRHPTSGGACEGSQQ